MLVLAMVATPVAWSAPAAPPAAGQAVPVVPIEPAAVATLEKMGNALRGLGPFALESEASVEVVLDSGQKIELDRSIRYRVHQPDRLRIDMQGTNFERQLYFQGGKLTVWSPRRKYYATVDAKATTLGGLVAAAARDYDIELPLADLFLWGTDAAPVSELTSAIKVGDALIDGERVEQLALRQPGVDWQVWISASTSLPRKLVITSLDDPAQPEFTARLAWDTAARIPDSTFAFQPPADAHKIPMVPAGATSAGEKP